MFWIFLAVLVICASGVLVAYINKGHELATVRAKQAHEINQAEMAAVQMRMRHELGVPNTPAVPAKALSWGEMESIKADVVAELRHARDRRF